MSTATWEQGECRVATQDEPVNGKPVTAWVSASVPGLAITASPAGDTWEGHYAITHVSSGHAIAKAYKTRASAERAAMRLAKLTDWTLDETALREIKGLGTRVLDALGLNRAVSMPSKPQQP